LEKTGGRHWFCIRKKPGNDYVSTIASVWDFEILVFH